MTKHNTFFKKSLNKYGKTVIIKRQNNKQITTKCFINDLTDRHHIDFDNKSKLYIGPLNINITTNDTIIYDKQIYRVVSNDTHNEKGEDVYIWAILKSEKASQ